MSVLRLLSAYQPLCICVGNGDHVCRDGEGTAELSDVTPDMQYVPTLCPCSGQLLIMGIYNNCQSNYGNRLIKAALILIVLRVGLGLYKEGGKLDK